MTRRKPDSSDIPQGPESEDPIAQTLRHVRQSITGLYGIASTREEPAVSWKAVRALAKILTYVSGCFILTAYPTDIDNWRSHQFVHLFGQPLLGEIAASCEYVQMWLSALRRFDNGEVFQLPITSLTAQSLTDDSPSADEGG